jgi:hypothetical protein
MDLQEEEVQVQLAEPHRATQAGQVDLATRHSIVQHTAVAVADATARTPLAVLVALAEEDKETALEELTELLVQQTPGAEAEDFEILVITHRISVETVAPG